MGRTSDGRERLLEAASNLLRERSYTSIGVAEICAAAGVQKGSFYYYFESKQALALAVIDEHWVAQRREWSRVFESEAPLLSQLRELFELTTEVQIASASGTGSVTGCLFGNLALEMSGQDDQIRERIQAIFEEQIALVTTAIEAAVVSEEISPVADARHVAKSIVAQLEGLVLFAKLFNEPAELDPLLANSMSLLGIRESAPATSS
jgi:TetR/AcrR family transcriptional repressor of nem operon